MDIMFEFYGKEYIKRIKSKHNISIICQTGDIQKVYSISYENSTYTKANHNNLFKCVKMHVSSNALLKYQCTKNFNHK